MGSVGDALGNAIAEPSFASIQNQQLDRRWTWHNRTQLVNSARERDGRTY